MATQNELSEAPGFPVEASLIHAGVHVIQYTPMAVVLPGNDEDDPLPGTLTLRHASLHPISTAPHKYLFSCKSPKYVGSHRVETRVCGKILDISDVK